MARADALLVDSRRRTTDIVFAIDSILVAVAMSPGNGDPTGGILGIVMMRMVIGQLLTLVELPDAGRRGLHHHRGSARLLIEYLHSEGHIAFEIEVAVVGADRADLWHRAVMRAAEEKKKYTLNLLRPRRSPWIARFWRTRRRRSGVGGVAVALRPRRSSPDAASATRCSTARTASVVRLNEQRHDIC